MPLLNIRIFKFAQKPFPSAVSDSWRRRHKKLIVYTSFAFIIIGLASPYRYMINEQAIAIPEKLLTLSNQVPGTITHIYVRPGQRVLPGDKLVQLKNPELKAQASIAQIESEQARLHLLLLKANPSWQSTEQAVSAQEILKSARTVLASSMHRLDSLTVKAPIEGNILTSSLDRLTGVFVHEATPLVKIGDTQKLKLLIPVPEQSIRHLSIGDKITGIWTSTGKTFRATITHIPSRKASFPTDYFEAIYTRFGGPAPKQQFESLQEAADINYPIYIAEASMNEGVEHYHENMRALVKISGARTVFIFRLKEILDQLFN